MYCLSEPPCAIMFPSHGVHSPVLYPHPHHSGSPAACAYSLPLPSHLGFHTPSSQLNFKPRLSVQPPNWPFCISVSLLNSWLYLQMVPLTWSPSPPPPYCTHLSSLHYRVMRGKLGILLCWCFIILCKFAPAFSTYVFSSHLPQVWEIGVLLQSCWWHQCDSPEWNLLITFSCFCPQTSVVIAFVREPEATALICDSFCAKTVPPCSSQTLANGETTMKIPALSPSLAI